MLDAQGTWDVLTSKPSCSIVRHLPQCKNGQDRHEGSKHNRHDDFGRECHVIVKGCDGSGKRTVLGSAHKAELGEQNRSRARPSGL